MGNCDFRINRETSSPVQPMSRENSDGNYPEKGQVRRRKFMDDLWKDQEATERSGEWLSEL